MDNDSADLGSDTVKSLSIRPLVLRGMNMSFSSLHLILLGFACFLLGSNASAQAPNFGDDSSTWSQDGECDDPRFQGTGMASTLLDEDRFSDATDCRDLFNLGRITLRPGER